MQSLLLGSGPNIRKIESQPGAQPSYGDQHIEMITNTRIQDRCSDRQSAQLGQTYRYYQDQG